MKVFRWRFKHSFNSSTVYNNVQTATYIIYRQNIFTKYPNQYQYNNPTDKEYFGEKKIGYVEGLFDIIDNKIKIKGVVQTDSLINGKYEHDFSCEGYISNRLFK